MASFKEIINSGVPVLVDFHADWCGPCHMQAPILEELSKEIQGKAKILKVDVDKNQSAAATYGVRSIPTLILFKNGEIKWRQAGVAQKETLKSLIEQNI